MFNLVLYHPEIPHNAGAAGRLAVATDTRLHLIRPLGFSLDEKHLRRTGLDYWPHVDLHLWDSMEELRAAADPSAHFWLLSTKAEHSLWEPELPLSPGDYFVFGPESKGLPESWLRAQPDSALRIPMPGQHSRSLNLSTAVAIVLYEAMRRHLPPTLA
ncbi:MAG: tRNA (cytidine(34)-2'-O)-methyltransferase [Akkermansiaceae bacterium]|nr:tRNA (cytidine(34)-2'-O)-methyltransferase [Akkermansiaceae bacterium]